MNRLRQDAREAFIKASDNGHLESTLLGSEWLSLQCTPPEVVWVATSSEPGAFVVGVQIAGL